MNEELDQKLQSMPTAKMNNEKKQLIHQSLMNFTSTYEMKKSRNKFKGYFVSVGGIAVAALLALIIFIMPKGEFGSHAFLAEDEIRKIDELKTFDRVIMLPTYAPFEIEGVDFEKSYRGPYKQDLENEMMIPLEEDNPKYQDLELYYFTTESPIGMMLVTLMDGSLMSLESYSHYSEKNLIEFDNGRKGLYLYNGAAQMLAWEENGVIINLAVTIDNKSKQSSRYGPIPKEEIVKIAESFKVYKK
ncbi:hypothetical protein [Fredinandcohnia quinoae]|uniref:DUF4367 domain-containing protein n=1 Tax=Fredinandcohnia quinoae TaxID=2918902 RepID=A0AAW5E597_9BACI|nr:hypothetical protein [Fredinandcohnia sp. SECRCQ15]MCH1626420.1 hypothetical protein [Fredinandcohnia sp. SECRCQ15]